MRRLPRIMFVTGATIIVVVALLVSGLRMMLPLINDYRAQIVTKVQSISGIPLEVGFMQGTWETFGPTLELRDIRAQLPQANWQVQRVTLALDVWQSLLHWRWQFRDMTFYQLQLDLNTTLDRQQNNGSSFEASTLTDIFLRQLDHFDLRNSRISFLTPSGPRAELEIPQLTWLNSPSRHRAEGQISLSTINGQHGVLMVRMDLHDNQGILSNGTVYMQADNIDLKPWISRWLHNNTGLDSAEFSLAAWLSIKSGEIYGGNVLLNQGQANWTVGGESHQLAVDNFVLEGRRHGNGWQIDAPELSLKTDGQPWPKGHLSALWLPENTQFIGPDQSQELRIRATNIQLERVGPILPTLSLFTPELMNHLADLQPQGIVDVLALDIPINQLPKTRFQAKWHDISWQHWDLLPGVNNFAGALSGSAEQGRLDINLKNSLLPYGNMFRAPLEVSQASGAVNWQVDDKGWELWSDKLDVRAKSLWGNGSFHYMQPNTGQPWLKILSGIRLYDATDAWRYFPVTLMGEKLADYLTEALQGGQVDNATLIYNGNPHDFPYKHKEGQFQVYVPLRNATFQFQPDWPALDNLAIDLNFLNEGLWMNAPHAMLGKVTGSNISAIIPDYLKEKLYVDAEVAGAGHAVHDYFIDTPLKDSVAETLQELQVGGNVSGRLHLDIPLEENRITHASGEVTLKNNSLLVKPLQSQLENISGKFRFNDGNLESDILSANWFGQPLTVDFTTKEQPKNFLVNVGLHGDWLPAKLPGIPADVAKLLSGSANWQGKVAVQLPKQGKPDYKIDVTADLKKVSSHLPSPLDKSSGQSLPLQIQAVGGLESFTLSGSAGGNNVFNSQWLIEKQQVELARAIWQTAAILKTDSKKIPPLPEDKGLVLKLPGLDGEGWLALLGSEFAAVSAPLASSARPTLKGGESNIILPKRLILQTPQLLIGGQTWHELALMVEPLPAGTKVTAKGQEVDGSLLMAEFGPWHANFDYLYYNPQWAAGAEKTPLAQAALQEPQSPSKISFHDWPALQLRCKSCWILGQNVGRVNADLTPKGNILALTNGLIEAGNGRAKVTGQWQQEGDSDKTKLNVALTGAKIDETISFFGLMTPMKDASFDINADVNWQGVPWQPQINTLNGTLKGKLGRGLLTDLGGGRAGQLLRLVSFDALLRKLQLDFSDTFSRDFAFDSIRGTANIKNGVMHTNDLVVDGLAADIAMSGNVDLAKRQIAMEAVITPEISATVGVATAFAINPVVGAAVFAASKILGPLWSKVSLIRYQITGSLDQPTIHEVLRQLKESKAP
ncbi:AsmA2 domain-containing protein YhdP [Yersinia rochesterensis]|uniref:AsmA2 domain-containing protein YhdP n=1 Tax=Yersinia rochesterensis TaxID=1604335 RepID=UPI00285300A4|nr:AsmA2 domain-containing protein YhdP [Yersinia rochesterensis]MDR5017952.1 AsmA2 domain-containing protein YhdP [Yersinia rochesterensis]